jgi:GMP synthase-like glutamine amidotransferase
VLGASVLGVCFGHILVASHRCLVIGLDQYKQAIGNIPMQIKKLRADLDQAMNVTVDDGSEDEAI